MHGIDDPTALAAQTGMSFMREHDMTPKTLTDELHGAEKALFKTLYAGAIARRTYRLYEFRS